MAIKILPEIFSRDPQHVQRFEREAKLLASLNHPNIAAIYGFDDANGTRFLVMEYVEGDTLASIDATTSPSRAWRLFFEFFARRTGQALWFVWLTMLVMGQHVRHTLPSLKHDVVAAIRADFTRPGRHHSRIVDSEC